MDVRGSETAGGFLFHCDVVAAVNAAGNLAGLILGGWDLGEVDTSVIARFVEIHTESAVERFPEAPGAKGQPPRPPRAVRISVTPHSTAVMALTMPQAPGVVEADLDLEIRVLLQIHAGLLDQGGPSVKRVPCVPTSKSPENGASG